MTALKDITDPKMIAKLEKTAARLAAREEEKAKKKAARAVLRTEKRAQAARAQEAKKAERDAKNAEKKAAREAKQAEKDAEKRKKQEEKAAANRVEELAKLIRRAGKFAYVGESKLLIDCVIVEASRVFATDGKTGVIIQTTLPTAAELGVYARGEDGEWKHAGAVKDQDRQMPDLDRAIQLTKPITFCTLHVETIRQAVGFLKAPGTFLSFQRDQTQIVNGTLRLVFGSNPVSHLHAPFGLDAVYFLRALEAIDKAEGSVDIVGSDALSPFRLVSPTTTAVVMPVRV